MNNSNIKPTVEGGLLAAVTVLLGIVSAYVPIIGMFVEFFWATPLIILTVRQGVGRGLSALFVATILLSMLTGPLIAIRLALSYGLAGLTLGYCVREKFDAVRLFTITLAVSFVAQIISIVMLLLLMDIDVMAMQTKLVKDSLEQTLELYETMGIDQATIDQTRQTIDPAVEAASILMPSVLMLMALLNTIACFGTTRLIFRKIGLTLPEFPPFAQWKFSIVFLYMMGFALIGMYWGSTREITALYEVSVNVNLVAMGAGLIEGFSLMSFAADHFKLSKIVRRLIYVIVILNGLLLQVVAFTGLFDMYFDYRRRLTKKI